VVAFKLGDPRRTSSNPGEDFSSFVFREKVHLHVCTVLYSLYCTGKNQVSRAGSGRLGSAREG
jgi:hypothetical protein